MKTIALLLIITGLFTAGAGINTPQPNTKSTFGHWIDNGCCMVVCFCRQSRPSGDIEDTIKNWSPRQVRAANDYWQKVFEVF